MTALILSLTLPLLVMAIYLLDGKILMDNGAIAIAESCCCDECHADCCGRPGPEDGGLDALPCTLHSEVLSYTCGCLDNTSNSESVQCLTGIDGKDFTCVSNQDWDMNGDVFCDDGDGNETCEISSAPFHIRCGDVSDCDDFWLEITNETGCDPVVVYPEPGGSCNPLDMTFVIPWTGCVSDPPVNGCTVTMRVFE